MILSKELKLRAEQRKQINNLNTHVIHRHTQNQQACRSIHRVEEMNFGHSCSNKTGLIFNARQLKSVKKEKAGREAAVIGRGEDLGTRLLHPQQPD